MWRYWSDVAAAGSRIKASQVSGLRSAVDEDLAAASLDPFPWSWTNVGAGDRILAVHFTEMRAAIQNLWDHNSMGSLPMWSSGVTPGGPSVGTDPTPMHASDITDLRVWLNKYGSPCTQGVNSFSFDPNESHGYRPVVGNNWASDIVSLRTTAPRLNVRCTVVAGSQNLFDQGVIDGYCQAFRTYTDPSRGLRPCAVFTRSFYYQENVTPDPNAPLDPATFKNPYIDGFVSRLKAVLPAFYDAGLRDCIIWNEPNVSGKEEFLPMVDSGTRADKFAALLYHSRQGIKDVIKAPERPEGMRMYWGGVQFGMGWQEYPDDNSLNYIAGTYQVIEDQGFGGGPEGLAWPWDGINFHIYGDRPENHFRNLFREVSRRRRGDPGELLCGEWGFQITDPSNIEERMTRTFNEIKPGPGNDWKGADRMFWFSHNWNHDLGAEYGLRRWDIVPGQPFGEFLKAEAIEPFYGIFHTLAGP